MGLSPERPSKKRFRWLRKVEAVPPVEPIPALTMLLLGLGSLPRGVVLDGAARIPGVRDVITLLDIVARGEKVVEAYGADAMPHLCAFYIVALLEECPFDEGRNYEAAQAVVAYLLLDNGWESRFTTEDWASFEADLLRERITEEELARLIAALISRKPRE